MEKIIPKTSKVLWLLFISMLIGNLLVSPVNIASFNQAEIANVKSVIVQANDTDTAMARLFPPGEAQVSSTRSPAVASDRQATACDASSCSTSRATVRVN